jgi:hypothetical protein
MRYQRAACRAPHKTPCSHCHLRMQQGVNHACQSAAADDAAGAAAFSTWRDGRIHVPWLRRLQVPPGGMPACMPPPILPPKHAASCTWRSCLGYKPTSHMRRRCQDRTWRAPTPGMWTNCRRVAPPTVSGRSSPRAELTGWSFRNASSCSQVPALHAHTRDCQPALMRDQISRTMQAGQPHMSERASVQDRSGWQFSQPSRLQRARSKPSTPGQCS